MNVFINNHKEIKRIQIILPTIYRLVGDRIKYSIPIQSSIEPWLPNKDITNTLSYLTLLFCCVVINLFSLSLFPITTREQQVSVLRPSKSQQIYQN